MALQTDAVQVANLAWCFAESGPLDDRDFIKRAAKLGVKLDGATLRALYRQRLVQPLLVVRDRRQSVATAPDRAPIDEPWPRGTIETEFRLARDQARLVDPAVRPYDSHLRFERRPGDSTQWWPGALYSRYQLLAVWHYRHLIERRRYLGPGHSWVRVGPQSMWDGGSEERYRDVAIVLTALDARYMPKLDPEFIHLSHGHLDEWDQYRAVFDPVELSRSMGYSPERALADAEWLLLRAKSIDPMGDWSEIVRRAHRRKWESLTGSARAAIDLRVAAEVLLLFYEDLAEHGFCPPLPELHGVVWEPRCDRLSRRDTTLDEDLGRLGLSPHPSVVLVVEGETEDYFVPRVFDLLGLRRDPDLVRTLVVRGNDSDLTKLAAFAAAPLISRERPDGWDLIRPPTRLVVIFDPENRYVSADAAERQRQLIIDELQRVVEAQDAQPDRADLEDLVRVHTWTERCFEFEHFTDEELAEAIARLSPRRGGLSAEGLVAALATQRANRQDIKNIWRNWPRNEGVSKTRLAEELWPTLRSKIEAAMADEDAQVPPLAKQISDAYHLAQSRPAGTFVLGRRGEAGS